MTTVRAADGDALGVPPRPHPPRSRPIRNPGSNSWNIKRAFFSSLIYSESCIAPTSDCQAPGRAVDNRFSTPTHGASPSSGCGEAHASARCAASSLLLPATLALERTLRRAAAETPELLARSASRSSRSRNTVEGRARPSRGARRAKQRRSPRCGQLAARAATELVRTRIEHVLRHHGLPLVVRAADVLTQHEVRALPVVDGRLYNEGPNARTSLPVLTAHVDGPRSNGGRTDLTCWSRLVGPTAAGKERGGARRRESGRSEVV